MDETTGEEFYLGERKSSIRYNADMQIWNMTTRDKPGIYATSQASRTSILLGRHQWNLHNEPKCLHELEMVLTSCHQSEFTCQNGTCIDMTQRCNQEEDCADGSDEKNCRTFVRRSGYRKDKPAPPRYKNLDKNTVKINMALESIQSISETASSISLLFNLETQWWDSRLTYENLKNVSELNILTWDEFKMIWQPMLVFNNTKDKKETVNDKKTVTFVTRSGKFYNSDCSMERYHCMIPLRSFF